ncbi:MAG: DPP IV N-terminal domain-containing protein [Acidobacteriota bacterium]|nr:DPP IV N-terminal domain-containing protein [Acidobacteriota bacterium]
MYQRLFAKLILIALALSAFGCQRAVFEAPTVAPASLRDVPSVKLNYRFETDVPAPPANNQAMQSEERNAAVQNDFDQNRPQEILDKTITSPDKQRVLAVYHKVQDFPAEFRLDMYTPDGKLLQKITHDGMAVHFAETIIWSPASTDVAFVAMARVEQSNVAEPSATPADDAANASPDSEADTEANANAANADAANADANISQPTSVNEAPKNVFTFRTEQLYVCNADGGDLKPLTQNEGLIYFYFVWSPDSAMLAALAGTYQEWNYLKSQADLKSEQFIPAGRLRLVEKNGRERRLDDNPTTVRPVWSPDSAKVGIAFDTQVRIYDAIGDAPTQAAIPLRNQLLISSKAYDEEAQRKLQNEGNANTDAQANANGNTNGNTNANTSVNVSVNQPIGTLPDAATLVSFNPVINLEWTEDKMLYLQTGYVKLIQNEADSARSYLRWHRLIFSPQAVAIVK